MQKLIISIAPNGGWKSKEKNPHLPILVDEVAEDVERCFNAGAAIAHLHGRSEEDLTVRSYNAHYYVRLVKAIRSRCNIVTNISTGGFNSEAEKKEQLNGLEAQPDMCSLNIGSTNFEDKVYYNHPEMNKEFAKVIFERKIKPEFSIFDLSHMYDARKIIESGDHVGTPFFGIAFGMRKDIPLTLGHLQCYIEAMPEGSMWNALGMNECQLPLAVMAILLGGHVRVGLEDVDYYEPGKLATNVMLVERIVRIAKELGREIASAQEAREMLCIPKRK